ncbi:hypothetical protein [Treponema brennaborense]|uniref:Uncharacterized protein n=1 Tax=Treponema brennaborense (strain DSM 12168 / CIP 105900 / DD5/3) TaxID=906968 RepID=F4LJU3_TREBD|nr:hypothetical protein [Treponema brennaborense]AEE16423.1 hypothetical protein Trebr_0987 [Treponema brennaborense DSM 12168]
MKKIFSVWFVLLASAALYAQTQRPIVSDIKAEAVSTTAITVTWRLPAAFAKTANVLVYRSTEPIAERETIKRDQPVAEAAPGTTSYRDTLPAYREYYYAVVLKTADGTPYDLILPSVNATIAGVRPENEVQPERIQPESASAREKITDVDPEGLRDQPLPFLNMLPRPPERSTISAETEKAAVSLGSDSAGTPRMTPYVFRNDKIKTESGEDSMLYDIIQTYFIPAQYEAAGAAITDFLQIKRSSDVTARSIFYLGETYYYLGDYRDALSAFLNVQDDFPELAARWIQASIEAYAIPESE